MVKVIEYQKRTNAEGKDFFVLILMGAVEFIKSSISGNFYASAFKASITTTFNEEICKGLVGRSLPGIVERVTVEPYEYKVPETGETIMISHRYVFNPIEKQQTMEQVVFGPEPIAASV